MQRGAGHERSTHGGRSIGFFLLTLPALTFLAGCSARPSQTPPPAAPEQEFPVLALMSLADENNTHFERETLGLLARRQGFRLQYVPAFESDNDRLELYQELLRKHSPQPDLFEIDIIWPSILSEDLIDLTPYFGDDLKSFPPELIQAFTVRGRLAAVPVVMDTGLLYYRSDLLKKYGFVKPPKTWDELEKMANVIQNGERRAGKKDFWGFVWQGQASEALTCNALEWFYSQVGSHILEPDRTLRVYNRPAIQALERAVSWIGTISPPGVTAYNEDDSFNVWQAGNAAFMRNWVYIYGAARQSSCPVRERFGVAAIPGGAQGSARALGGVGIAVSRYSSHRGQAVAALQHLTSKEIQSLRAQQSGSVPTRWALQQRADLMNQTPFQGRLAGQAMTGVVARPSALAGRSYDAVSRVYFEAIHSALTHQTSPGEALRHLESQLVQMTGFHPVRP